MANVLQLVQRYPINEQAITIKKTYAHTLCTWSVNTQPHSM